MVTPVLNHCIKNLKRPYKRPQKTSKISEWLRVVTNGYSVLNHHIKMLEKPQKTSQFLSFEWLPPLYLRGTRTARIVTRLRKTKKDDYRKPTTSVLPNKRDYRIRFLRKFVYNHLPVDHSFWATTWTIQTVSMVIENQPAALDQ